jgi:UDP-N-acetylmuramate dehydrogenase
LAEHGTAGSFFKNPVISTAAYDVLKAKYPDLPGFPGAQGVKVPLAFVLDRILGLKGFRMGKAWLYEAQPLVLVLDAGGSAEEVDALVHEVAARVMSATGIAIEREVRSLPEK